MPEYWLGLGSNLGDRREHLAAGLRGLEQIPGTSLLAVSPVFETAPVGKTDQPAFLNLAASCKSALDPEALLAAVLALERRLGRVRTERWGPRTLDIDLLWASSGAHLSPALELPHPRMLERAFVLQPLARLVPEATVAGRTVRAWAASVGSAGVAEAGDLEWRLGGE
ncbi:2-amino-4-hydroxy-6-hydroxymethyldihydropteridine diphosphokinase [Nibricoccus sp. IMCC34717]|uniref:2-amino-4-hydroxy-6- hydroxymethyldihydropteridine diphosphokinase n=1 Tax=Nibricoccus sp. IMCC34717 TaxID=3034021 RepID=UPI00384D2687